MEIQYFAKVESIVAKGKVAHYVFKNRLLQMSENASL